MGPLLIDLATVTLALAVLYGRSITALAVLIGTVLLVPATLVTPHLHTSYATANHLVIAAAVVRLVGEVRRREVSRDVFRATPLHLALGLLLVTWAVVGVVFAESTEVSATAEQRMINLAFTIAFFVVTLALIRELDDPWLVMQLLTVALAVTAGIAVIEHFTRDSFGHWLFGIAGHPGAVTASHVLEQRAGHVRVRASGEFALSYAWVAVMLLPVATLVTLRVRDLRRMLGVGVPVVALTLLAVYWTYSRSAAAAVPAVFILLAMAVRDRRTLTAGGLTALGALLLFAADPTVRHHLSLSTDSGSVGIRFQRLPPILEAVAHHPYLGLGLGGLQSIGVTTTDNFYLSAYGETGVVGAAVLIAVCVTALVQTARGITVSDRMRRAVIAACILGFLTFLVSGAFDDALLLGQPAEIAMLLLALGSATAEPELGYALLPKWSTPRVIFLTVVGGLAGLLAFAVAPVVSSQERSFTTIGPLAQAVNGGGGFGQSLIGTVCEIADAIKPDLPKTSIDCRDTYTAPGVGMLRVESPSTTQTIAAYSLLQSKLDLTYPVVDYATQPISPPVSSKQTAWKTAPVSGAVLGFALAFIAPLPLRRRKSATETPPEPAVATPPPVAPEAVAPAPVPVAESDELIPLPVSPPAPPPPRLVVTASPEDEVQETVEDTDEDEITDAEPYPEPAAPPARPPEVRRPPRSADGDVRRRNPSAPAGLAGTGLRPPRHTAASASPTRAGGQRTTPPRTPSAVRSPRRLPPPMPPAKDPAKPNIPALDP